MSRSLSIMLTMALVVGITVTLAIPYALGGGHALYREYTKSEDGLGNGWLAAECYFYVVSAIGAPIGIYLIYLHYYG